MGLLDWTQLFTFYFFSIVLPLFTFFEVVNRGVTISKYVVQKWVRPKKRRLSDSPRSWSSWQLAAVFPGRTIPSNSLSSFFNFWFSSSRFSTWILSSSFPLSSSDRRYSMPALHSLTMLHDQSPAQKPSNVDNVEWK